MFTRTPPFNPACSGKPWTQCEANRLDLCKTYKSGSRSGGKVRWRIRWYKGKDGWKDAQMRSEEDGLGSHGREVWWHMDRLNQNRATRGWRGRRWPPTYPSSPLFPHDGCNRPLCILFPRRSVRSRWWLTRAEGMKQSVNKNREGNPLWCPAEWWVWTERGKNDTGMEE